MFHRDSILMYDSLTKPIRANFQDAYANFKMLYKIQSLSCRKTANIAGLRWVLLETTACKAGL